MHELEELETLTHFEPASPWGPTVTPVLIGGSAEGHWPQGVPRTYDQFFREYGEFIKKQVSKHNRVTRNFEDLFQEVCMRLIASNLLDKFNQRARRTMPETLVAADCVAYLGYDFPHFHAALHYLRLPETQAKVGLSEIHPVKGDLFDKDAVFWTSDITELDAVLPSERPAQRKMPWVSPLGFKAYLTQAIHNHFANWCRTRARKYQDMVLPGSQVLSATSTGDYIQSGNSQDAVDWESRLVAMSITDDELLAVVEQVEDVCDKLDIDLRDEDGALSSRGVEILDLIAEGRSITEAVQAQARAEVRSRARVQALG